ncbi:MULTISPECIES: hypothetical protein [unclassified Saccharopolyspora]|uniref:hypothetical protein n=2 Tax=Saccharopolyspora TaxID=1835 RepID=UPI001CD3D9A3|nr:MULTISPECIES: hypothetical protein [unclassified Saccharopolyspora]MCA1192955.1 hypothetical protein [Saccharopolyspora sp. 6V]MCA1195253.1 hypothetical protein [Saccharopolyspora sp. 6V]MCA1226783.1 hypothetical protein [Saccharopolyspora sp. 6M]
MAVPIWAASCGPVDSRWHGVRRSDGGALPAWCGVFVYGPVHLRRGACPDGVFDRDACRECVAVGDG